MMKIHLCIIGLCLLILSACRQIDIVPNPISPESKPLIVGADKDAHGCIPSAGYTWCAKTNQCVRPWELAKAQGFKVSEADFDKYCGK